MALVETAKSNGAPKSLAELKAELDQFEGDVEQFKNAVEQLAQIKREK